MAQLNLARAEARAWRQALKRHGTEAKEMRPLALATGHRPLALATGPCPPPEEAWGGGEVVRPRAQGLGVMEA